MTRRGQTVLVGAVVVLMLAIGLAYMPVPYVAFGPGETVNTLGVERQGDKNVPVITVTGTPVSESKGQLRLTTVGVYENLDLGSALRFWLDDKYAVVPRETIYRPGESRKEVQKKNTKLLYDSQDLARIAAFRELGYNAPQQNPPFEVKFDLAGIGGPSAGLMFALGIIDKVLPEDLTGGRIIAGTGEITIDGKVGPIGGISQKLVGAKKAGAKVFLTPEGNCHDAVKTVPKGLRLIKASTLHEALGALRALRDGNGNIPACN